MIEFCSYYNTPTSTKLPYPNSFSWLNFINLTPLVYISRCFLYHEVVLREFSYKKIIIEYIISNMHMQVTVQDLLR